MLNLHGNLLDVSSPISRRGFLSVGALAPLGVGLSHAMAANNARGAESQPKTSAILFFMAGGPSHIDSYDLKTDQPAEIRGPFGRIATTLPGLDVCDLMPQHAAIGDKLAVIRSITHDLSVHDDAVHWVQTGYPLLNARQRGQQNPSQGSVVSYVRGANVPGMPAYACIPEDYRRHLGFYEHAAFLSSRHNAVDAGGDPALGNYRLPDFLPPKELTLPRVESRRDLLSQMDGLYRSVNAERPVVEMDAVQRQAFELVCGSKARDAFDLSKEPAALRDRYGRHAYGQSALLARRLVEAGVTYVTINLYEKDVDWWDDHYTIEKNLRKRLPLYDQALAALIEDIYSRGLNDRVLIGAFGEFGRAPRIDQHAGRGHWPRAMHAVLSGAGIKTGQIIGSTTKDGGEPADRALGPGDLLATIYHALGIDPHHMLPDRQNRPVSALASGQPIRELVG